eukprot:8251670-Lingulodinium_polyedra.AAC.1
MLILIITNAQLGAASEYSFQSDAGVTDARNQSDAPQSDNDAMSVWWPAPDNAEQMGQIVINLPCWHARLEGNRVGLLFYTGAWGNLSGKAWVQ